MCDKGEVCIRGEGRGGVGWSGEGEKIKNERMGRRMEWVEVRRQEMCESERCTKEEDFGSEEKKSIF